MTEVENKFLLVGDKFIPEMHLKQPGFMYSACALFTKSKENTCSQHDMAYGDIKDLPRRTTSHFLT